MMLTTEAANSKLAAVWLPEQHYLMQTFRYNQLEREGWRLVHLV